MSPLHPEVLWALGEAAASLAGEDPALAYLAEDEYRLPPGACFLYEAGPRGRDPKGGLTAAGRRWYRLKAGSRLKPGVSEWNGDLSKRPPKLTREKMKRWASWAVRFYGRKDMPPLLDPKGRPTRYALTAAAWGCRVPRTEAQARAIGERGRKVQQWLKDNP